MSQDKINRLNIIYSQTVFNVNNAMQLSMVSYLKTMLPLFMMHVLFFMFISHYKIGYFLLVFKCTMYLVGLII